MIEFIEQLDLRQTLATWIAALIDPWQFLEVAYNPTQEQFTAGLEFFARMFLIIMAILLMVVLACGRGSLGIRAKMLGYGLLGLATVVVTAVVMHGCFWLFGGKASFAGTCLTYIYTAAPYQPFMAFASWIIAAGMPTELRPYMLNPFTASKAGALASKHPDTDHFTVVLGTLLSVGLILWTLYLIFEAMRYTHELSIFRSLVALIIGLIVVGLLNRVLMRMSGTLSEAPQQA